MSGRMSEIKYADSLILGLLAWIGFLASAAMWQLGHHGEPVFLLSCWLVPAAGVVSAIFTIGEFSHPALRRQAAAALGSSILVCVVDALFVVELLL